MKGMRSIDQLAEPIRPQAVRCDHTHHCSSWACDPFYCKTQLDTPCPSFDVVRRIKSAVAVTIRKLQLSKILNTKYNICNTDLQFTFATPICRNCKRAICSVKKKSTFAHFYKSVSQVYYSLQRQNVYNCESVLQTCNLQRQFGFSNCKIGRQFCSSKSNSAATRRPLVFSATKLIANLQQQKRPVVSNAQVCSLATANI